MQGYFFKERRFILWLVCFTTSLKYSKFNRRVLIKEAVVQGCFVKNVSKNVRKILRKKPVLESVFNKVVSLKGALSGLRQILATENPIKTMKNAFYFTSKAVLVLKIFKFLS